MAVRVDTQQWRRGSCSGQLPHSPNFGLLEIFLLVRKFSFKNTEFGAESATLRNLGA